MLVSISQSQCGITVSCIETGTNITLWITKNLCQTILLLLILLLLFSLFDINIVIKGDISSEYLYTYESTTLYLERPYLPFLAFKSFLCYSIFKISFINFSSVVMKT